MHKITLIFLLGIVFSGNAQFRFKRELGEVDSGWQKIHLPISMYEKISPLFTDIRIYGINQSDTTEVPYFVQQERYLPYEEKNSVPFFNPVRSGNTYFYTFQPKTKGKSHRFYFEFGRTNFDWDVQLEGSTDGKTWYKINERFRMVSIATDKMSYAYTQVDLINHQFDFYRIAIPSDSDPNLLGIQLAVDRVETATFQWLKGKQTIDYSSKKQTIIHIEFPFGVPLHSIQLPVLTSGDYYRRLTVRCGDDIQSTIISSLDNRVIPIFIDRNKIKTLMLTIENGDNEPLSFGTVEAKVPVVELIAKFPKKMNYALFYDDHKIAHPMYDLIYFKHKLPTNLSPIQPKAEIQLLPEPEEDKKSKPIHPLWLWGSIGLIILVLGGFTLKMITQAKTNS